MSSRPPVSNLDQLNDTDIVSPAGSQTLLYNSLTGKWFNGPVPVPTLANLGDVSIVTTVASQVLKWDATSSKWVNYGPLAFSDIAGSIAPAQLGSSAGTADVSTFYRGDGAWIRPVTAATVATLPASPFTGQVATVSDGTASLAWGATVTGGGSTQYLVWWNGANWTVMGK
jgi:hypothetical protein